MRKKIFSSVVLAVVLICGIVLGVKSYKYHYGEVYRDMVAKQLTSVMYNNGEYAIIDSAGTIVGDRFDGILGFGSGCLSFVIRKGDKRGFLSTESGKEIFAPQFDHAWIDNPKFGLAAVVKDNKLGFVNVKTGKIAIEPTFEFQNYHLHYDYVFKDNGYCIIPGENSKFGVIDTTGRIILPCIYEDIEFEPHGFVVFQSGYKFGLCDSALHIILPPEFDRIKVIDIGIMVSKLDYIHGHQQYLLAYNGKDVINKLWLDQIDYEDVVTQFYEPVPVEYDDEGNRKQGKKSPYSKFYLYDRFGVFDERFNIIIPAVYDEINYIGDGYFGCELENQGAIVNSKGEYIHKK